MKKTIRSLVFVLLLIVNQRVAEIVLRPTDGIVSENTYLVLNCTYTTTPKYTIWSLNTSEIQSRILSENCITTGFLENESIYNTTCGTSWTSVLIYKVTRHNYGDSWFCKIDKYGKSNEVILQVQVPVKDVTITEPNKKYIQENHNQSITCTSSSGRPDPIAKWYLRNREGNMVYNLTQFSRNKIMLDDYALTAVESTLNFKPNRTINGWHLYCEIWTQTLKADITSREITVNVSYPPGSDPKIQDIDTNSVLPVIESETGTFVCSITGGNPPSSLTWECFGSTEITYDMLENTSVISKVNWKANRNQNTCSCISEHIDNWKRTVNVTFNVHYPPSKPTLEIGQDVIFYEIHVKRNERLQVACKTNSSPLSKYTWTGPGNFGKDGDTLDLASVKIDDQGEYKCQASNLMTGMDHYHVDGHNASSFNLIVLYLSGTPLFRLEDINGQIIETNILNVIRNDAISIYCDVKGNPSPNVTWDTAEKGPILSITSIFSDTNRTCTATNMMKEIPSGLETRSMSKKSLSIEVFYPPSIPEIHVSDHNDNNIQVHEENISVIESATINFTCISKSKPLPSYEWSGRSPLTSDPTNILRFQNISRHITGTTYTCRVKNDMRRSYGGNETGENNSTIVLDILYPATIMPIEDRSVIEGSQLSIPCPVIHGNPPNLTSWSRGTDKRSWNQTLYIQNVSRADDTVYSCSVITEMFPTIGSPLRVERNESFHLNVFFPSAIKIFSVSTISSEEKVVINKTDNASLICIAEGNPLPDLFIKDPRGDIISKISKQNITRHIVHNASYKNAGEYICTGRNNYTNDLSSSSKLILIVRSQPRPSSDDTSVTKVATAMHRDVQLDFEAWNYLDKPNETVFIWFKENVSIPDKDSKHMIDSNELQTNITIRNTTQQDLGLYKLNVKNSVGTYTHFYELKATDKPESSRDFRVINGSITDSSVTLKWSPGFNGGFPQIFVIIYRKKNANIWLNKSTKDNGDKIMNYTLYHLTSSTEYEIEMFSNNIKGNSTHTERLQFITRAALSSETNTQRNDNSSIIAGSISAAVVVVVVVIIGAILFLRKRQNKSTDSLYQNVPFFGSKGNRKCEPKSETKKKRRNCPTDETTFGEKESKREQNYSDEKKKYIRATDDDSFETLQEVDDVPIILNERTEYCNSPDNIKQIDRITVAELYAYVFGNDGNLEIEYQKLPSGLQNPCTFARKPENIALNRYNGIYPYDHSRVKISDQPDFFINACYIDGYRKRKAYIASLGPTSKTTGDFKTFWQMVWHERSDMIVMLTNLHEPSGMKCEKYWPNEGTSQQYGDVTVTSKTFEAFAEYTVRTFGVSKGKEHRLLTHLHYTAWPDKTVPEDVTSLLDLRKRMKDVPIIQNGPIVIHCSAGIGRTGTLIALDILIEEGLDKQSVNVFECVENLRNQRVKMVQTLEQYIYIHKCLVNALSFDDETISKERIHEHFENKNDQQYSTLFQKLKLTVETDNKSEQKARLKNMKNSTKNRQEADVPGDRFIVFLNLTDGKEGAEYINAVYVNSFKRKDHFIVAQSPLSNTVTDFVSMIFQEDCSCIATMEDLKEPGMTVGTYLPELNKKATFGNFQVSSSKLEETSAYIIRKIKIKYTNKNADGEKCFYHFQYKNWTTRSKTPENVAEFVQFISEVEEYANELGEDRSRVVVHCLKANERSCLFCAVAIIIEKLKVEGNVNILNVIRHLRTRRRTAIVSKEQLKFCYEAASAYIKQNKH